MVNAPNIFIIEDDASLRTELSRLLELEGYAVHTCADFPHAVNAALQADPQLVILDLRLPNADGHSICKELRGSSDVPIVVLTSSDAEFDEVMALKLGATDYVTKPYRPAVLLARIQSALGKTVSKQRNSLSCGDVTLDLTSGQVTCKGSTASLTRNEQSILALLMRNPGLVLTRHEIMCALWESDAFVDDNTLTVNVNRLRKTLTSIGAPEKFISTERGVGYVIR